MDVRVCLCLLVLGAMCCTARELVSPDLLIKESEDVSAALWINNLQAQRQLQPLKDVSSNERLCKLCEEYTATALDYLSNNETQTKIIDRLHKTCAKMPIYKPQCTGLVDHYATLFFLEISTIKPEDICQKVNLCQEVVSISQQFSQNRCDLCHQVAAEALSKLKDPDTQLDILQYLLKACGAVDNYAKKVKCKKLVFKYAPVIFVNAERLLEKNDVCTILHACEPAVGEEQTLPRMQAPLHSAS